MSTYATTRPVDLAQLGGELRTPEDPVPLSMSDDGTTRTITCYDETVTQAQLEAAVEAHVPAPPPPTAVTMLQDQYNELIDFLVDIGVI